MMMLPRILFFPLIWLHLLHLLHVRARSLLERIALERASHGDRVSSRVAFRAPAAAAANGEAHAAAAVEWALVHYG